MSSNYTIESNIPFVVKIKNRSGRVLLPVWILLFSAWGYFQVKFIMLFVGFFIALLRAEPREGITIIYNPPMVWMVFGSVFIVGVILGLLFGVFTLQEILWRLVGTETFEISKEKIIWSRQIPLVRLVKSYPVATLLKIKVLRPENVDVAKLDKFRPAVVLFRGMSSGAISLDYEKRSLGVVGLIRSVDAEAILNQLKDINYFDLPIEV